MLDAQQHQTACKVRSLGALLSLTNTKRESTRKGMERGYEVKTLTYTFFSGAGMLSFTLLA